MQDHDNRRRQVITVLVILGILAAALAGCSALGAGPGGDDRGSFTPGNYVPNTISVSGYGDARAAADIVYVQLGVNIVDPDPNQAVSQNNARMQAVADALITAGIAETDLQTAMFNLWPEDRYDPQTGMPTGERFYHVDNSLNITVRDLDRVGEVIQAGIDAGASGVNSLAFSVEDSTALYSEARQEAIADARRRAEEIAEGLGAELGEPLVITEGSYLPNPYPYPYPTPPYPGGGGGGSVPYISPGQYTVSTNLFVIFNLK
jgi:hypothetical protein